MKKVKVSLALIAFVLATGTTVTFAKGEFSGSSKTDAADCSSQPNSPILDVDSHTCIGTRLTCCYEQNSSQVFATKN